jgi:hypothetical protein
MPYGTLIYRLGEDNYLLFPVIDVQLRDRKVIAIGSIQVWPGQPDVTLPAGDWPCTLLGEDSHAVYSSVVHFDSDNTVHCADGSPGPATLTVVQPFGDPAMQTTNANGR